MRILAEPRTVPVARGGAGRRAGTPASRPAVLAGHDVRRVVEDVENGWTLPAEWYTSREVFEAEQDLVLGRTWHIAGLVTDFEEPGAYITTSIGDRDFIVVRDGETIRAFHNVCPHRASPVVSGCGTAKLFQCPYHAWTYRLDGSLSRAPGMESVVGFDPAATRLTAVSVGVWDPFVFVNPDPDARSLEDYLGDLPARVAALGVDLPAIARERDVVIGDGGRDVNWKIWAENSLECYHCAVAHPGFAATMDLPKYQIALLENSSIQAAPIRPAATVKQRPGPAAPLGPITYAEAESGHGLDYARFHWIFPTQFVSVWPGPLGSFTISRLLPVAPDRTRWISYRFWSRGISQEVRQEITAWLTQVGEEDFVIMDGVQRGVRSGAWSKGRFQLGDTMTGEHAAQHFDLQVARHLLG
jgi:choline monooxygenase